MAWLLVAIGGAVGAMMRYGMGQLMQQVTGRDYPYGTLTVNVLGSLFIGVLYVAIVEKSSLSEEWRLALVVGVLGAFTTFSSFSMETIQLLERSGAALAMVNVVANVILCLLFCWLGLWLARQ